jgi:integrase
MQSLEWRDVSADAIRLRRENSKNKNPRLLPVRGELAEIVERARQSRRPDCPSVFHFEGRSDRRLPQSVAQRRQGRRAGQPAYSRPAQERR